MVVDEKPADDASIAFLKAVLAPLNVSASVSPSIASLACYVKVGLELFQVLLTNTDASL